MFGVPYRNVDPLIIRDYNNEGRRVDDLIPEVPSIW